jgi:hypothetical protein
MLKMEISTKSVATKRAISNTLGRYAFSLNCSGISLPNTNKTKKHINVTKIDAMIRSWNNITRSYYYSI